MVYDPESIAALAIREEIRQGGLRIRLTGLLGRTRCPIQLDIGFGDAVTPGPEDVMYPTLLDDLPGPRLKAYPRETVVAEKLEAMTSLGMINSRMKDYFDLRALCTRRAFERRGSATGAPCNIHSSRDVNPLKYATGSE